MSYVRIEGLTKRFAGKPPTVAIDDLDLEIEQGEFLVLLGPSGCGKTTTLRCLAGLETPGRGAHLVRRPDGLRRRAEGQPARPTSGNIGMVFQSYALWPHMTVRKNIGYPLRARRIKRDKTASWIEETAALVDCGHLLDRYPAQLSGGQQQRVALARGLVARPDLVLFDEPLSNLDARLRDQVRAQLHELHERLGFTAVFVTHDQSEALALGDRLAIMRAGRIEQLDTPQRVFEEPATEYVAGLSSACRTGWRCERHGRRLGRPADGRSRRTCRCPGRTTRSPSGCGPTTCALRPRRSGAVPAGGVGLAVEVVDAQFGGRHMDVVVSLAGTRLHAKAPLAGRTLGPAT